MFLSSKENPIRSNENLRMPKFRSFFVIFDQVVTKFCDFAAELLTPLNSRHSRVGFFYYKTHRVDLHRTNVHVLMCKCSPNLELDESVSI